MLEMEQVFEYNFISSKTHFKRETPALECKRFANHLASKEDTNG